MRATWRVLAVACALLAGGCGDGEGGDESGSGTTVVETPAPDVGCVESHPNRAPENGDGLVVACFDESDSSLRVANASSQVLSVAASSGEPTLELVSSGTSLGDVTAGEVAGSGWDAEGGYGRFILPIGGVLVADGTPPVSVSVETDNARTLQAHVVRHAAGWIQSLPRGRSPAALAANLQGCANEAASLAQVDAPIADTLRSAIATYGCGRSISAMIREAGGNPAIELPRARSAISSSLKALSTDYLITALVRLNPR